MLRWLISLLMTLRGYARAYIKDVEKIRATAIIDIIHSGEQVILCVIRELWLWHLSKTHTNISSSQLTVGDKAKARCPEQGTCVKCGYISSQEVGRNILKNDFSNFSGLLFKENIEKSYLKHLQVCKACVLLAGLNMGLPQLGVGKSSKHRWGDCGR